jgi:hypothetical protein
MPKFAIAGLEYIFGVITFSLVPKPVVKGEYVGVTPTVNLPASSLPGTQVVLFVEDEVVVGWHPGQSISVKHCCPVIAHLAVGPQKFVQLCVVFKGKSTV